MKAAFYARVSTGHQDPENQVLKLRDAIGQAGHFLASEYVDVESGKIAGRRQFQQMMHDARRRKFDVLYFFSFSRLTREGPQKTARYLWELDQAGVSYVSLSEKSWLDTTGPLAFVITMLISTFAQMELEQLSARTKAGLERARAQGKRIGRPRRILDTVRLKEWQAEGVTVSEMARRSGVSLRTIARRLTV